MRSELSNRMVGRDANALASSIVLVCRPRPDEAKSITRTQFLRELRRELPEALRTMQHGNIAPVDFAQSAIGPGMGVFSRYKAVTELDGEPLSIRVALSIINQTLDEVLSEQEGESDPETRWAIAWFTQNSWNDGLYGLAETLSTAKGTSVTGLVEAGVAISRAGKVRLLSRDELPANWNPASDKRLTVWETTQHMIRALDKEGESGASELLGLLCLQNAEVANKARDLAYRLYSLCERKKWASEALAYNSLVIAWPQIQELSQHQPTTPTQTALDF
jgi:putative DNA methylase